MYCKHCGKEIADDSKFCQHCGGKQDVLSDSTKSVESVADKESSKGNVIEIPTIKANFSDNTKWILFGYGIWFVLNLYWLFAGDKSSSAANYFQPFSRELSSSMSYYDMSEFIVYVIGVPLAIWGFLLYRNKYKGKEMPLVKFIKTYGMLLIGLIVFVFVLIIIISRCSDEDVYYVRDNYQNLNMQIEQSASSQEPNQSVPKEDFFIKERGYFPKFDSQMNDIDRQMRLQKRQIKQLPSALDNYYP